MDAVKTEISRFDWGSIACRCGRSAEHVAADLLRFLAGRADKAVLEDHVMYASFLYEPAVPTAAVLMAALGENLTPEVRLDVLQLLAGCCSADSPEIASRCEVHIRDGVRLLYDELLSSDSIGCRATAYEILACIEGQRERLRSVLPEVRERLPFYLQSGPCADCGLGDSCPRCPGAGLFD